MRLLIFLCLILIAACDNVAPTPTPTRALSAPTLEASPVLRPLAQEHEPTQFLSAGQNDPTAAALPRDSELPPLPVGTLVPGESRQPINVTAPDGSILTGDLYPTAPDARVPGILMLAPDRSAWLDLPLRLQAEGYTVLSMNAREVGNSTAATGDFSAMIEALSEVSSVDPGRIAVIGAESGADEALAGCAAQLLCDILVLFSPLDSALASDAILRYNPRPLFITAAQDDANFIVADRLRGSAQGTIGFEPIEGQGRGASLLQAQPALADSVIAWLQEQFAAQD